MTKINWKIRFKNPVFIAQIIMAILLPIVAYFGLNVEDLTSWGKLGNMLLDAILNPYVVGLVAISLWNAINDPTTTGVTDSTNALNYENPSNK
jgi:phi LC3 family holin